MFVRFYLVLLCLSSTLFLLLPGNSSHGAEEGNFNPEKWKAFSIEEIEASFQPGHSMAFTFLNEPTLTAEFLEIHKGGQTYKDEFDSVYVVLEGKVAIKTSTVSVEISEGGVGYVRGGIEHRITPDNKAKVLQLNPTTQYSAIDPEIVTFTAEEMRAPAKPDSNEWNPFLQVQTMAFGLYMLPLALGGDDTLTHTIDEINVVIKGNSKFRMDDDEIDIGPGSVMWVKAGVGHYFHDLSEDFEVLILFRKDPPADEEG